MKEQPVQFGDQRVPFRCVRDCNSWGCEHWDAALCSAKRERRSGVDDRRAARPDRMVEIHWAQVDRREREWRRAQDRPNYRAVARNDRRTFDVPDGPDSED